MYVFLRFLTFFFKIQKNMTFYVFWVVALIFSNSGLVDAGIVRDTATAGNKIQAYFLSKP